MNRRKVLVAFGLVAVALALVFGVVRPFSSTAAERAHAFRLAVVDKLNHEQDAKDQSSGPARAPRWSVRFRAPAAAHTARTAATAGSPITFGEPTISTVGGVGFEQDLRLDLKNNLVYTSAPGSLSSDTSWIWKSADSGKTFKWITAAAPQTGKAIACAGGGDTELDVANGKLYFNDLTLANFSVARSDDQGTTIPCNNTGVPDSGVDRQWYTHTECATPAVPNACDPTFNGYLYLSNDEIGPGGTMCGTSTGNNLVVMYRSPTPTAGAAAAGLAFGAANKITPVGSCDEGIMGNNEVSPVQTFTDNNGNPTLPRKYFHIYDIHDDATFSKILIGRCYPVPFTKDPSGLSCVDLPVANLGDPSTVRTGGNFPSMAIDTLGHLYAVWEQAPVSGGHVGNSSLMYAYSTDEGTHWSAPIQIPTPGLLNNVFAWAAAGSDGHVDIAWYGTDAAVNPANPTCADGPDSVNGVWSLYMTQTLNGHAGSPTFTSPVLAGEHYVHKGNIQTVMGGQCGDRTLGDFIQLRIGTAGQAEISYADSNNVDEVFAPHGMYVRQSGGPGVYAGNVPPVSQPMGSTADPTGDGTYAAGGVTSANMPNLDVVGSSVSVPDAASCHPAGTACLRVRMRLSNLTLGTPAPPDTDTTEVWQTQWLVPAAIGCSPADAACANGGRNPMVYAESTAGGAITCWEGENAAQALGGGVTLTYPGSTQLTAPGACDVVTGANGTITIDIPLADARLGTVPPLDTKLYSITATTMTTSAPPDSSPNVGGIGGVLFNLIDVAPGYDFNAH